MKLLLYTRQDEKARQIAALAAACGAGFSRLAPSELNTPLCLLLGLPPFFAAQTKNDPMPLLYDPPELLLLHGFTEEALDRFLKEYRAAGIKPIPLKAVTTPHNLGWTPFTLARHLEAERRSLSQGRRLTAPAP